MLKGYPIRTRKNEMNSRSRFAGSCIAWKEEKKGKEKRRKMGERRGRDRQRIKRAKERKKERSGKEKEKRS